MPPRSRRTATDTGWMSIGALARATGIAVETLRTWERRYGVPAPVRKPSGHRLYPSEVVEHLRRVEMLLNRGHRPAEVLALAPAELDRLLALSGARPGPARPRAAAAAGAGRPSSGGDVEALLAATAELDRDALVRGLRASWTRLGPLRFLEECAVPFMNSVGDRWEGGRMDVRHEHFATACLSDVLREVRGPFEERAGGPLAAVATLDGDAHEGGILMASVLLAFHGWRVIYLGPNTPPAELAGLARSHALDAVVLGLSASVPRPRAARVVRGLRAKLPRRVELWVGGAASPPALRGVERFDTLASLDRRLALPS